MHKLLIVFAALLLMFTPVQANEVNTELSACGAFEHSYFRAEVCVDFVEGDFTLSAGPNFDFIGPITLVEEIELGDITTLNVDVAISIFAGGGVSSVVEDFNPESLDFTAFVEFDGSLFLKLAGADFTEFAAVLPGAFSVGLRDQGVAFDAFYRFAVGAEGIVHTYGLKGGFEF